MDNLLSRWDRDVGHNHNCAFPCKQGCFGPADASTGSSYQSNFTIKPPHVNQGDVVERCLKIL
jgi:hypothetical protein